MLIFLDQTSEQWFPCMGADDDEGILGRFCRLLLFDTNNLSLILG